VGQAEDEAGGAVRPQEPPTRAQHPVRLGQQGILETYRTFPKVLRAITMRWIWLVPS
jgi:hypothetical protein